MVFTRILSTNCLYNDSCLTAVPSYATARWRDPHESHAGLPDGGTHPTASPVLSCSIRGCP